MMELVERSYLNGDESLRLPLLASRVLSPRFVHGFTTRAGGVSPSPYESLNLGFSWGDAREHVLENRRRLRLACGAGRLFIARQVHGTAVAVVDQATSDEALSATQADAVVTNVPGTAVAVLTADCVPLLFGDPVTGAVAAVHAGWRGLVAGVAPAAVAALARSFGSRPRDLRVALGPAIGACCFEVGPEVVAAFAAAVPGKHDRPGPRDKPHVDLKSALVAQLQILGVPAAQIDAGPECTKCDPAGRFFSYRREAGRGGALLSIIVA
jgi:polyphenol oxidase